jgi:hypothetical protein
MMKIMYELFMILLSTYIVASEAALPTCASLMVYDDISCANNACSGYDGGKMNQDPILGPVGCYCCDYGDGGSDQCQDAPSGAQECTGMGSLNAEVIAEISTVDYVWDETNTKEDFIASGNYIPENNAVTGIKVDEKGAIYIAIPRWRPGVPSTLNKLVHDESHGFIMEPWPSWDFNTKTLHYCQSMAITSDNNMWILETGRENFLGTDPSAIINRPAGFYIINIASKLVQNQYLFPESVVPSDNSFLNDIAIDESRGYAYFTSTWGNGLLIVYEIQSGTSWSYTGASTMRAENYNFCVSGYCYGTDGVGASPVDGIALQGTGTELIFSAVQGTKLYCIQTKYLRDQASLDQFNKEVRFLGDKTGGSDGLLYLNGMLLYGDVNHSNLGVIVGEIPTNIPGATREDALFSSTNASNSISFLDNDVEYRWIDTFALDPLQSQSFYFTTNRLDMFFNDTLRHNNAYNDGNFRIMHSSVFLEPARQPTNPPSDGASYPDSYDNDDFSGSNSLLVIVVVLSSLLALMCIAVYCKSSQAVYEYGDKKSPMAQQDVLQSAPIQENL